MNKTTTQLNDEHKQDLDNLVDETIMSGIMEDLVINIDDKNEDDEDFEEEYERREMQLNKEALQYVIDRLQSILVEWSNWNLYTLICNENQTHIQRTGTGQASLGGYWRTEQHWLWWHCQRLAREVREFAWLVHCWGLRSSL